MVSKEERDATPPSETEKAGKFWVYEQAIRIPYYAIFDTWKDSLEVYHLFDNRYTKIQPNNRGHYLVPPMGVELGLKFENDVAWLRWWDDTGNLLLTGDERAVEAEQKQVQAEQKQVQAEQKQVQAEAIALQERHQKEKLANYLRSLGINPDEI